MHEISLVQALLRRVEREARSRHATVVHRIAVRIGRLAGVEREQFATAFAACRGGTLCGAAELVIVDEDARWCCDFCGADVPDEGSGVCDGCGWPARLAAGGSLALERIDMDVP